MSFMFTPIDYDDTTAVNRPGLNKENTRKIIFGKKEAAIKIANDIESFISNGRSCVIAIDGYLSAEFDSISNLILQYLQKKGICAVWNKMEDLYLLPEEINDMLNEYLPHDNEYDQANLFGKVYDGSFKDFIDLNKAQDIIDFTNKLPSGNVMLLSGYGCACNLFTDSIDLTVYIDVTPKDTAVRARNGKLLNIGDRVPGAFQEIMRRNYYVDFEIVLSLRKYLLQNNLLDYYISEKHGYVLMPADTLYAMLCTLAKYPFRCKPVYIEGVWGGGFIRKIRNLPSDFANIAWVYEMIAFEVSVVVDVLGNNVEIPFSTFLQKFPVEIMGEKCVSNFGGYFPIRFNYDDTFHGNGNMSIQVHPDREYAIKEYNEKGSQDEAYYVIATGHGAKIFLGFREGADPDEFLEAVKQSEKDGSEVDYMKYINYIDSRPGRQVMIPGGTVHASGRNQLVLELGSLTTGAYTYKMYDYIRKDLDGTLRPLHIAYAEKVLKKERKTKWVNEHIAIEPKLIHEGKGYREFIIGNTDLMYYETRNIELDATSGIPMKNNGQFTVLTVVDGEDILIQSTDDEDIFFAAKFLEIVIVPAFINNFIIYNRGGQPAVIHKTILLEP